jgi:hypothetical protein
MAKKRSAASPLDGISRELRSLLDAHAVDYLEFLRNHSALVESHVDKASAWEFFRPLFVAAKRDKNTGAFLWLLVCCVISDEISLRAGLMSGLASNEISLPPNLFARVSKKRGRPETADKETAFLLHLMGASHKKIALILFGDQTQEASHGDKEIHPSSEILDKVRKRIKAAEKKWDPLLPSSNGSYESQILRILTMHALLKIYRAVQ